MSSKNKKRENRKKYQKVTIKHIAKAAGLSFSTVARVLRKDPVVKIDTREKILKIARELNYYPNSMASVSLLQSLIKLP